jgi:hypothetical protein
MLRSSAAWAAANFPRANKVNYDYTNKTKPEDWLTGEGAHLMPSCGRMIEFKSVFPIQRSHRPSCHGTIKSTHFAIRPGPKISDGKAFEEGICLNDFFSLGSTRCVGGCHNKGGVGILHC